MQIIKIKMKAAYICSPYSGDIKKNKEIVRTIAHPYITSVV